MNRESRQRKRDRVLAGKGFDCCQQALRMSTNRLSKFAELAWSPTAENPDSQARVEVLPFNHCNDCAALHCRQALEIAGQISKCAGSDTYAMLGKMPTQMCAQKSLKM